MNLEKYLDITPELQEAIKNGEPVVALESTILSHGMPYPENLSFAAEVEKEIRACGAYPATMALIGGKIKVGLSPEELELMCRGENVGKVSRRDFATYLATGKTGATTVASTMMCAALAGIHVFATGGIGGVHRHGEVTMDVSADLQELARTPVAVICAGAKQILDIGRTLEYLETMGVPVIGNGTSDFPAFFCKKSGFGVDYAAQNEKNAIGKVQKLREELEEANAQLEKAQREYDLERAAQLQYGRIPELKKALEAEEQIANEGRQRSLLRDKVTEEEIARIIKTKLELEMPGGVLIGNPIPDEYAMDFDYMEGIITKALELADAQHIHGKEITPFLLAHIKELTGGESFASNVQLALNNARCAARIAVSLAKM